jgi:N4-gp56 family major capsid protein
MADTYVVGGSGNAAIPPAALAADQSGGPADPLMTDNFHQLVTALIRGTILENLREDARWLVPGAYIPGKLMPGTNLIRHISFGDLPEQDSVIAVEGEPPEVEALTIGYHEYSVTQKGRIVGVTDVAMDLSPFELMSVAAERVGYDARMTVDRSVADAVLNSSNGLTLLPAGTGPLEARDIRRWVVDMKVANIPTFPDGFYVAMVHPDVIYDFQSDTSIGGWIEAAKYGSPDKLLTGEMGRMYGVRFVETTVGTSDGAGNFQTVVFGPDYFAFGDMQSIQTYMVRPGGDHMDPLAQKGLVGYKGMWGASTILDDIGAAGPKFGICSHTGSIDRT